MANEPKIAVIGSTNMDMVVNTDRIPVPGETILARNFFMNPGGKGANQAVAVARLGGKVIFVSKVGNDVFGHQSFQLFNAEGIDSRFVLSDDELPSGVALITVDKNGENTIVVNQGANGTLLPKDISPEILEELGQCDILLMQFEIPMETILFIAKFAVSKGIRVIVNPAPAHEIPTELLKYLYLITPNEVEAGLLAGMEIKSVEDSYDAAKTIMKKGIQNVIITLGSQGALVCEDGVLTHVEGDKVIAKDTTAAGDVFNGALVTWLSRGMSLTDAVKFACKVAAISVTREGAQSSIPYLNEVVTNFINPT